MNKLQLLKKLIREEVKKAVRENNIKTEESVVSMGVSGLKSFARKNGYSVRTKSSGGRVPYMYLKKDGKEYGPFDPTVTTSKYLNSKLTSSK